jgi:hypothetical protein
MGLRIRRISTLKQSQKACVGDDGGKRVLTHLLPFEDRVCGIKDSSFVSSGFESMLYYFGVSKYIFMEI